MTNLNCRDKRLQRVLTGAMWLYNQHRYADYMLSKKELNCQVYEYSKIPYRELGERYIGLRSMMEYVLYDPIWQDAYKLLQDYKLLEMDKDWDNPTHFKLLYDFDMINGKGD